MNDKFYTDGISILQEAVLHCKKNVSYADLYLQKSATHSMRFENGKIEQVTSGISDGVQVTSSGAVAGSDLKVIVPNASYYMFGNAMPTQVKLEDITVKAVKSGRFNKGSFNIIFFGSNGSVAKVGTDETMKTFCKDAYDNMASSELKFFNDGGKGWYLYDDATAKAYPMDKYPIDAGRGFNLSVSGIADGVEVTIPSPLADAEAAK